MILDVSPDGLLIPRELLDGAEKVDVSREDGRIVIRPLTGISDLTDAGIDPGSGVEGIEADTPSIFDPIHGLGSNPVRTGLTDASVRHDHYIYGDPHGERS